MTEEVFFDRTWEPLLFYLHLTGDFVFFLCFFFFLFWTRIERWRAKSDRKQVFLSNSIERGQVPVGTAPPSIFPGYIFFLPFRLCTFFVLVAGSSFPPYARSKSVIEFTGARAEYRDALFSLPGNSVRASPRVWQSLARPRALFLFGLRLFLSSSSASLFFSHGMAFEMLMVDT